MRYCLALDLKDDAALIATYEAHHQRIWPEVAQHLRKHGVTGMEIYRLGTRMVMLMETDDAIYDAERMALATETDMRAYLNCEQFHSIGQEGDAAGCRSRNCSYPRRCKGE